MKLDLELSTIDLTSRGKSVSLDLSKLSTEIIQRLIVHGATQKVADAAAGAKKLATEQLGANATDAEVDAAAADFGKQLMQKVVDNLLAGSWGVERSGGAGVDPVKAEIRSLLRPQVKAKVGAEKWKSLSEEEKVGKIDGIFEKLPEAKQTEIEKAALAEIARKKAAKKLIASISID